jgi:ferredoxin-NADP reductase
MEGMTAPPMSVSLTQETGRLEDHDRVSRNTWMVLGGIGMAAMMAIMIL